MLSRVAGVRYQCALSAWSALQGKYPSGMAFSRAKPGGAPNQAKTAWNGGSNLPLARSNSREVRHR
jgi:hypothetical protein